VGRVGVLVIRRVRSNCNGSGFGTATPEVFADRILASVCSGIDVDKGGGIGSGRVLEFDFLSIGGEEFHQLILLHQAVIVTGVSDD
jgi:hypothetical protein